VTQFKAPFVVTLIVILAFFSGYKQQEISSFWQGLSAEEVLEGDQTVPAEKEQGAKEIKESNPPAAESKAAGPLPVNPYAALLKKGPTLKTRGEAKDGALTGTLDSVRPGKISPEQQAQRNTYFDKLREQLREMQGEKPPEGAPAQAPKMPNAVQPNVRLPRTVGPASPLPPGSEMGLPPDASTAGYAPMPGAQGIYPPQAEPMGPTGEEFAEQFEEVPEAQEFPGVDAADDASGYGPMDEPYIAPEGVPPPYVDEQGFAFEQ